MSNLIINGGKKLRGTVINQSAKNSALVVLCACVMIKGKTTLLDVPDIEEVNRMVELLSSIGVKISRSVKGKLVVDARGRIVVDTMDKKSARAMRSSLMLLGALAGRVKKYRL